MGCYLHSQLSPQGYTNTICALHTCTVHDCFSSYISPALHFRVLNCSISTGWNQPCLFSAAKISRPGPCSVRIWAWQGTHCLLYCIVWQQNRKSYVRREFLCHSWTDQRYEQNTDVRKKIGQMLGNCWKKNCIKIQYKVLHVDCVTCITYTLLSGTPWDMYSEKK